MVRGIAIASSCGRHPCRRQPVRGRDDVLVEGRRAISSSARIHGATRRLTPRLKTRGRPLVTVAKASFPAARAATLASRAPACRPRATPSARRLRRELIPIPPAAPACQPGCRDGHPRGLRTQLRASGGQLRAGNDRCTATARDSTSRARVRSRCGDSRSPGLGRSTGRPASRPARRERRARNFLIAAEPARSQRASPRLRRLPVENGLTELHNRIEVLAAVDREGLGSSREAVTVSVSGGTDTRGQGDSVCIDDGRRLSNSPSVTVEGPPSVPLTADNVPATHDGESTFTSSARPRRWASERCGTKRST